MNNVDEKFQSNICSIKFDIALTAAWMEIVENKISQSKEFTRARNS